MFLRSRTRRRGKDFQLALIVAGIAIATLSLTELEASNPQRLAQATGTPGQPLQTTPVPQASPSDKPAESKPGGTRPTTPAPEPARPNPEAQAEGAKPALPPAPAEKVAPPIKEKK